MESRQVAAQIWERSVAEAVACGAFDACAAAGKFAGILRVVEPCHFWIGEAVTVSGHAIHGDAVAVRVVAGLHSETQLREAPRAETAIEGGAKSVAQGVKAVAAFIPIHVEALDHQARRDEVSGAIEWTI